MDFSSLQTCIYNRLLWINQEIRVARANNDAERAKRFVGYRKETDKLLSATKQAIITDPNNAAVYDKLSLLYRCQSLI